MALVRRRGRELRNKDGKVAVLGVSGLYHDSAAALCVDGEIVAAAQEERFSRIKGDAGLPEKAIEYVLRAGGLTPDELSSVVFYESPFAKFDRIISPYLVGGAGLKMFVRSTSSWLGNKLWVGRDLREILGKEINLLYGDHHLSHAAAGFYPSPFQEAAIITIDGVGEWTTTSIGVGRGSEIELLEQIEYPHSFGLLYSAFTAYCGFKINSGEYKLMGLAPYGEPRFADLIKSELIYLGEDGSYGLNPEYFSYTNSTRTYNTKFENLFGQPTRSSDGELTSFHADVAASIQLVCNEILINLARRARELSFMNKVCLSGGVALNVVAVGALERAGIFDEVWVQPAAGDAGSALGAALWGCYLQGVQRKVSKDSMHGCFLGPGVGELGSVERVLDDYGLVSVQLAENEMAEEISRLVASGEIVAVARGRMEFGPRALGARSILADARDGSMQLRLNLSTKFREGFRPFAPIVLAEDADTYFEIGTKTSPYMLKTYYVREEHLVEPVAGQGGSFYARAQEVRSSIPAVTHVDHSARVQTVARDENPFIHAVLRCFKERTGCSVMVNTSFNVRGEPIVCDAVDSVECFLAGDIDALVIEDRLVLRKDQTREALVPRRASARGED